LLTFDGFECAVKELLPLAPPKAVHSILLRVLFDVD